MSSRSETAERLPAPLIVTVGTVVLIDTAFYAVIAPLLPALTHTLHLSQLGAGVLAASYPAGMLVASLPAGVLAVRAGPRVAVLLGLVLLAVSTVLFGVLDTAPTLDLARFVEGAAGACSWAGGIAWLVAASPADKRGSTIGTAVGAAVFGAMLGPALGGLATAIGRPLLFCGLAALALGVAALTATLPDKRSAEPAQRLAALLPLVRRRAGLAGMWLMAVPAIVSGMLTVLGSLRLHQLGAGPAAIAATFLIAAAFEAVISPVVGRLSDRLGRFALLRIGLVSCGAGLACFTLPTATTVLAVLIVLTGLGLGAFWAPAMALLSDAADDHAVEQGLAAALMNLAWAVGQILGDAGSGGLAKGLGDRVPTIGLAVICGLTLLWASRTRVAA